MVLLHTIARAGFGFSLHYKVNLAAVLISHVWLGFGQSALMPGIFAVPSLFPWLSVYVMLVLLNELRVLVSPGGLVIRYNGLRGRGEAPPSWLCVFRAHVS